MTMNNNSYDTYLAIARNFERPIYVPGHRSISISGFNPNIDSNTAPEDVWPLGGIYKFITGSNVLLNIFSSSDDDNGNGSISSEGAMTIYIDGVDRNYLHRSEIVTLDGTNVVSSIYAYFRINHVRVLISGNENTNIGDITIQNSSTLDVLDIIPSRKGISQKLIYTIPEDTNGFLTYSILSVQRSVTNESIVEIQLRESGESWLSTVVISVSSQGSQSEYKPPIPLVIPPRTDVRVQVSYTTANSTYVSGNMQLLLVNNNLLV